MIAMKMWQDKSWLKHGYREYYENLYQEYMKSMRNLLRNNWIILLQQQIILLIFLLSVVGGLKPSKITRF